MFWTMSTHSFRTRIQLLLALALQFRGSVLILASTILSLAQLAAAVPQAYSALAHLAVPIIAWSRRAVPGTSDTAACSAALLGLCSLWQGALGNHICSTFLLDIPFPLVLLHLSAFPCHPCHHPWIIPFLLPSVPCYLLFSSLSF